VGQVRLIALYDDVFAVLGVRCAQVLLTYEAFGERTPYLKGRSTFMELLKLGVVPIVNENDTAAVHEIKVGDNDTMSALVAAMVGAQVLFLMTDVDALFDGNPRVFPTAAPLRIVASSQIGALRKQMHAGEPRLVLPEVEAGGAGGAAPAADDDHAATAAAAASAPTAWPRGGGGRPAAVSDVPADLVHSLPSPAAGSSSDAACGGAGGGAAVAAGSAASGACGGGADVGGAGSRFGTGGMVTKLKAAQLASAAGVTTVITATERMEGLARIVAEEMAAARVAAAEAAVAESGAEVAGGSGSAHTSGAVASLRLPPTFLATRDIGTTFMPAAKPVAGRKRWILALAPAGMVTLDAGAVEAVVGGRKSLFAAGITDVTGDFMPHDAVQLMDPDGVEVARALVNYSAEDCRRIRGKVTKEVQELLGYLGRETLADRENIVILRR